MSGRERRLAGRFLEKLIDDRPNGAYDSKAFREAIEAAARQPGAILKSQQMNSADTDEALVCGAAVDPNCHSWLQRPILCGWVGADEKAVEVVIADGACGAPNREFAERSKLGDLRFDPVALRGEQAQRANPR